MTLKPASTAALAISKCVWLGVATVTKSIRSSAGSFFRFRSARDTSRRPGRRRCRSRRPRPWPCCGSLDRAPATRAARLSSTAAVAWTRPMNDPAPPPTRAMRSLRLRAPLVGMGSEVGGRRSEVGQPRVSRFACEPECGRAADCANHFYEMPRRLPVSGTKFSASRRIDRWDQLTAPPAISTSQANAANWRDADLPSTSDPSGDGARQTVMMRRRASDLSIRRRPAAGSNHQRSMS